MPAKKRIFVAINLPNSVKEDLAEAIDRIRPLLGKEVRFLDQENQHLTISFLGYQDDASVGLISEALEAAVSELDAPFIQFDKIVYGPVGKPPRMIWLIASKETSEVLGKIQRALEEEMIARNVPFRQENRKFLAHLTIARFETTPKSDLPVMDILFPGSFDGESLDLMESHLKRSGAEYEILSKYDFPFSSN